MAEQDRKLPTEKEVQQANVFVQLACAIGLIICVYFTFAKDGFSVSWLVYGILGGGIIGTDNLLKLLKAVFRIGGDEKR